MAGIEGDATATARLATDWLAKTQGSARSEPQLCLGAALSAQARWPEAEAAFLAGRDAAAASDTALRARLGAMAGNAALAAGAPDRALAALDAAAALVRSTEDKATLAPIAIDRAHAAVALKNNALADAALAEAREADPANAQGWLLSATLSRRQGQLQAAQTQIERAAALAPLDAEIGLEAGVIAELSGREDAARRSWRSVVATAPGSDAARTAQGYLDQIGPGSATPATLPPQGR